MSMKGSASGLVQAVKELMLEWEQTKAIWNDVKSQEFERRFLAEIPGHAMRATEVMEQLNELLKKVRHECE